ncbi:MAG: hypothetical protein HKN25_05440 [Pyrinomonadaceae bacterium]|nr:hypothetical protein [Pyrinomonadaceae bacterium]
MSIDRNRINKDDFLKDLLYLLRETFEGSPEGEGGAYLDDGISFFSSIENRTAEEVSIEINGTSVVAHVEHAKFYLDRLVEFIQGESQKVNWELSWLIESVDDKEWEILRGGVRKSYENALQCFANVEIWKEDTIGEAISMIVHTAYHLGAIRQMLKAIERA